MIKKPIDAIKLKTVKQNPSAPIKFGTNLKEKQLPDNVLVRYLYYPGELEGGQRRRATDTIWSLDVYRIGNVIIKPDEPILYYLEQNASHFVTKRGFVRQELQVVPPDTELPPV